MSQTDGDVDLIAVGLADLRQIVFSEPDRLTVLNLHGNKLSHLSGLPILHHLVEINLSSNAFRSCELPELAFLPSLKVLDLSGNNIDSLYYLPFLPGLQVLSVSFNNLRTLTGLGENVPDLLDLDIRGNYIADALGMSEASNLHSLLRLWLGGRQPNPIYHGKENLQALHALFSSCASLESIDGKGEAEWRAAVEGTSDAPVSPADSPSPQKIDMDSSAFSQDREHEDEHAQEQEGVGEREVAMAPTPRFDVLARRFRSHEAIARKSKEGQTPIALGDLQLDPVTEDLAAESDAGPDEDLVEGDSNAGAGLRDSKTSLPVPDQAPQHPHPSTTASTAATSVRGPQETPNNPWGRARDGGSISPASAALAAVAAVAASQDLQLELDYTPDADISMSARAVEEDGEGGDEGGVADQATSTSVMSHSAAVSRVHRVADSATNTSLRSSAVSEKSEIEGDAASLPALAPSAPEPPNKEAALLLEQHALLEEAYRTAEALRARLEEASAVHEEKERNAALRITQLETSCEQERHKTEAALKRVFTAEAVMMKLRKDGQDKAVMVEEKEEELAKVKELHRAEDEAKAQRQLKTDELMELFNRQKLMMVALRADNDAQRGHLQNIRNMQRAEKEKRNAEVHALHQRIEQFRHQLSSVEEEEDAKTALWSEALERKTLALEEEKSRSLATTQRLQEHADAREKLERRFMQLQDAFDEATEELSAARRHEAEVKEKIDASAASALPREAGKGRSEEYTDTLTRVSREGMEVGHTASQETIEDLCAVVKSLRCALSTAEAERESEHKAASRLYTQMNFARDEIHRLRHLAGVKDEAGLTFRGGGMRLVNESLLSLGEGEAEDEAEADNEDPRHASQPQDTSALGCSSSEGSQEELEGEVDRAVRDSVELERIIQEAEELRGTKADLTAERTGLLKQVADLTTQVREQREHAAKAQELVSLLTIKEEDIGVKLKVKEAMLADQVKSIAELKGKLGEAEARCGSAEYLVRDLEEELERRRDKAEETEKQLQYQLEVEQRLKGLISNYHEDMRSLRVSGDRSHVGGLSVSVSVDGVLTSSAESLGSDGSGSNNLDRSQESVNEDMNRVYSPRS